MWEKGVMRPLLRQPPPAEFARQQRGQEKPQLEGWGLKSLGRCNGIKTPAQGGKAGDGKPSEVEI
jgi:hypothetical protein